MHKSNLEMLCWLFVRRRRGKWSRIESQQLHVASEACWKYSLSTRVDWKKHRWSWISLSKTWQRTILMTLTLSTWSVRSHCARKNAMRYSQCSRKMTWSSKLVMKVESNGITRSCHKYCLLKNLSNRTTLIQCCAVRDNLQGVCESVGAGPVGRSYLQSRLS